MTTPERITTLAENEVFVFGSNLAGRHGAGAALAAARKFGARYGVGQGPTGQCYAIPTKDRHIKRLPLCRIAMSVDKFIRHASAHPEQRFLVTPIGCGLAGYRPDQIAPMFASAPSNVVLPKCFQTTNQ